MMTIRQMLPKNSSDTFAFVFSMAGIHFILLFELLFMRPWKLQDPDYSEMRMNFHTLMGVYIYVNVMGSFWKVISTETSTRGVMLPTFTQQGWRFCPVCECNAPPRSYHCHTCERCILKRDHHCTFTANCIGFRNQRYYLTLLFYTALATVYASAMNFSCMATVLDGSVLYLPKLIFPFFVWVLRFISFSEMLVSGSLLFCLGSMCGFCALLAYHVRNLVNGQLTYENSHRIYKYHLGLKGNLRDVFGERWAIAWFLPWLPSRLPGDGLTFTVSLQYEDPKDM